MICAACFSVTVLPKLIVVISVAPDGPWEFPRLMGWVGGLLVGVFLL